MIELYANVEEYLNDIQRATVCMINATTPEDYRKYTKMVENYKEEVLRIFNKLIRDCSDAQYKLIKHEIGLNDIIRIGTRVLEDGTTEKTLEAEIAERILNGEYGNE